MTTLETLKAARAKIADEKHWTQRFEARDANGIPTGCSSSKATSWCSGGALSSCGAHWPHVLFDLLHDLAGEDVTEFNDSHTHAEVLTLFDKAIASLEAA